MCDFWPPKSHQKRLGALSARAQRPQTLCAHIFISFSLRRRGAVITWLIAAPSAQCREQARCSTNVHRADLATATQMTGATGRVRDGLSHLRGHSIPAVLGTFAAQKYRQVQDRQSPALSCVADTSFSLSVGCRRQFSRRESLKRDIRRKCQAKRCAVSFRFLPV